MKPILQDAIAQEILPNVTKPARYIGNEMNMIRKDPSTVSTRVALAFPEVYEIGMSYLGFGILYHILNAQEHIWAERVFAPWPDMEEELRKNNYPLYTLESFTALSAFDILGFTLQYELTYTNILNMLDLGKVPVWAADRAGEDPIVIAGGPCSCNPEPVAGFFDVVFIGDGEEGFVDVCIAIEQVKKANLPRRQILESLQEIRGVYIPVLNNGKRVDTRIVTELKSDFYPEKPLVPLIETTHNRLSIEVMRGCTQGCRYCNAGMIYRPVRERDYRDIVKQTATTLPETGHEEVSFMSLSISDYSGLRELLHAEAGLLDDMQVNYAFPSMRLDSFSEEIAEYASNVRKSGFTFAPESGSARLRRVINKNITDEDIFRSVEIALKKGWRLLKFYFMIGLPTETKEDIEALAELLERVIQESRPFGRVRFNVSLSTFSPKAHTPFQWEAQESKEDLEEKIHYLRKRLSKFKQVKLSWRDPEVSFLECVLGRGDNTLSQVIHDAWKMGAKFDGWTDFFNMGNWEQAFEQNGLDMNRYARAIPVDARLPWDHINKGVTKSFLLNERQKAYDGEITPDCRETLCYGCGIKRTHGTDVGELCKTVSDAKTEPGKETFKPDVPDKIIPAGEQQPIRLRVKYKKTGFTRFLSHLDLIRIMYRAFRAAGVDIAYTQGFNPKPKLSFSPPLSLGYTSEAEYMDVELLSAGDQQPFKRLNTYLPEGLEIVEWKMITSKVRSLSAEISRASYEVNISGLKLDSNTFQEDIEYLFSRDSIEVDRVVKGVRKTLDIKPYIESINRTNGTLSIGTKTIATRSVRVDEILAQLFPLSRETLRLLPVHRTAQFIQTGNTFTDPLEAVS